MYIYVYICIYIYIYIDADTVVWLGSELSFSKMAPPPGPSRANNSQTISLKYKLLNIQTEMRVVILRTVVCFQYEASSCTALRLCHMVDFISGEL